MGLQLSNRQVGDVTVVHVSGRLVLGDEAAQLRDELRSLADAGKLRILLDLSGVTQIDSSGVGELVAAGASISRRGGVMKLTNLTERMRDLMLITKLCVVFDIVDDEAAAIRSFA
jgi:anti-sigma B factor antagonist